MGVSSSVHERTSHAVAHENAEMAEELQQSVAEHEEQRALWDAAMEEASGVQEALKMQLTEHEERSELKIELVRLEREIE